MQGLSDIHKIFDDSGMKLISKETFEKAFAQKQSIINAKNRAANWLLLASMVFFLFSSGLSFSTIVYVRSILPVANIKAKDGGLTVVSPADVKIEENADFKVLPKEDVKIAQVAQIKPAVKYIAMNKLKVIPEYNIEINCATMFPSKDTVESSLKRLEKDLKQCYSESDSDRGDLNIAIDFKYRSTVDLSNLIFATNRRITLALKECFNKKIDNSSLAKIWSYGMTSKHACKSFDVSKTIRFHDDRK
jgi:hypothetical protein